MKIPLYVLLDWFSIAGVVGWACSFSLIITTNLHPSLVVFPLSVSLVPLSTFAMLYASDMEFVAWKNAVLVCSAPLPEAKK
ncbi:MAG: hypothetical protein PHH26_01935 [Candidatus Thermoplasmatota archaeon]|nr:hypothetical protein [Candidatus Thermoplasmatota archaeon]